MCGICGFFSPDISKEDGQRAIEKMLAPQHHRGPDNEGSLLRVLQPEHGSAVVTGLGHCRLSVIDLSEEANQPLWNEDASIALVLNGEIYNFKELRQELVLKGHRFRSNSDSEVILHLYEEHGSSFPKRLEGMFAGALLDSAKGLICLFRDRFGKKPLFYHYDGKSLLFSSTLPSLFASGLFDKEVDFSFLPSYFTLGYIPQPKSAYRKVFKMKPGHLTCFYTNGKRVEECYWKLEDSLKEIDKKQAITDEEILELLKASVRKRLVSDVPLGVFLSGGIDSSFIAALATEELGEGVKSFSIGFDDEGFNELPYAQRIAEHLKCDHHTERLSCKASEVIEEIIEEIGEPYGDPSVIPSWYLSRMTKQHVTVSLTGDGGDELFAGYDRYIALQLHQKYRIASSPFSLLYSLGAKLLPKSGGKKSTLARGQRFCEGLSKEWLDAYIGWNGIVNEEGISALCKKNRFDNVESVQKLFMKQCAHLPGKLERVNRAIYLDYCYYLSGDLLPKVDFSSMLHALECRSPFLDHYLVEMLYPLSVQRKLRGGEQKGILKSLAVRYLPEEIIQRKKAGFGVPLHRWMKKDLQNIVVDALQSGRLASVVKMDEVERMNKEHREGKDDHSYPLYLIAVLDLWLKGLG